jgi:hypothetical protein
MAIYPNNLISFTTQDTLENEDTKKDWEDVVNMYISGSWKCLCAIINATQTKEEIFTKFLFPATENEWSIWKMLLPNSIQYEFAVETNFTIQAKNTNKNIKFDETFGPSYKDDEFLERVSIISYHNLTNLD